MVILEVVGVALVAVSAGLFDWRLVPAVIGLFLIYLAREAE